MKKLTLFLFLLFPVLTFSQDKKFSYTFLDVIATNINDIGYIGDISLGLPASLYIKGSIRDEEIKSDNTVYQRSKKIGWIDWLRYSMELRGLLHKISPTHVFYITLELSMLGIILHNFIGGTKSFFVISGLTNHLTSKSLKMIVRRQIHRIFNLLLYAQKKHLFIFQNNDDRKIFLKKNMAFKRNAKVIRGNGVNPLVFYSVERPKNTNLVFKKYFFTNNQKS